MCVRICYSSQNSSAPYTIWNLSSDMLFNTNFLHKSLICQLLLQYFSALAVGHLQGAHLWTGIEGENSQWQAPTVLHCLRNRRPASDGLLIDVIYWCYLGHMVLTVSTKCKKLGCGWAHVWLISVFIYYSVTPYSRYLLETVTSFSCSKHLQFNGTPHSILSLKLPVTEF